MSLTILPAIIPGTIPSAAPVPPSVPTSGIRGLLGRVSLERFGPNANLIALVVVAIIAAISLIYLLVKAIRYCFTKKAQPEQTATSSTTAKTQTPTPTTEKPAAVVKTATSEESDKEEDSKSKSTTPGSTSPRPGTPSSETNTSQEPRGGEVAGEHSSDNKAIEDLLSEAGNEEKEATATSELAPDSSTPAAQMDELVPAAKDEKVKDTISEERAMSVGEAVIDSTLAATGAPVGTIIHGIIEVATEAAIASADAAPATPASKLAHQPGVVTPFIAQPGREAPLPPSTPAAILPIPTAVATPAPVAPARPAPAVPAATTSAAPGNPYPAPKNAVDPIVTSSQPAAPSTPLPHETSMQSVDLNTPPQASSLEERLGAAKNELGDANRLPDGKKGTPAKINREKAIDSARKKVTVLEKLIREQNRSAKK